MRYINDDKMPIKAKRTTKKITEKELWKLFQEEALKQNKDRKYHLDIDNEFDVILEVMRNNDVQHDLDVISFDTENVAVGDGFCFGTDVVGEPLLGFCELKNGFTFYGIEAGGDWEYPVFMIIYFDGYRFRGYIPTCGNMYNTDLKCAFGSEEYECMEYEEQEKIINKYKKYSWFDVKKMEDEADKLYAMKYGLKLDDKSYGYNWDLIEKDILTTFKVE